jgi:cytochrome c
LRRFLETISFRAKFNLAWIIMDSFEFNKIAGVVLGTALAVFGLNELSAAIYHAEAPEKPGYAIEVAAATPEEGGGAEEAPAKPLAEMLKAASAERGVAVAKACAACHDFTKGGPNKQGPNLWDIVDRAHGVHEGFAYSEAMAGLSAEKWTYEALDKFIAAPKAAIPGTKMAYSGLKSAEKRADLLAYLQSLSDAPKPFPAQ